MKQTNKEALELAIRLVQEHYNSKIDAIKYANNLCRNHSQENRDMVALQVDTITKLTEERFLYQKALRNMYNNL